MTKDDRQEKQKKKARGQPLSPHEKYLLGVKRGKMLVRLWQLLVLVALIGLWELLTAVGVMDAFFMSSPSRIVRTFAELMTDGFMYHIGVTLLECVIGFTVSMAVGCVIAVLLWLSPLARRISEPYLVVLNALPKIALGPLLIIWVGSGSKAIVLMAVLICVIVTIISVLEGLRSTAPDKLLLLRSMGASRLQMLRYAVLPSALPTLLSVLKINVGLSWVGTIMGEYLVSGAGLGYLIVYGGQVFDTDLVMTATVTLCVLAALMYGAVALAEKLLAGRRKKRRAADKVNASERPDNGI
ncbi:MAG TPA: ABC transporter permease [Candidatus Protoclostridium stercorigallinarum]|uniref:ABC transporter permease n=1 Tax=Candidatus Protoclostridium stercorigallinarum TaxID=2838741 RepID=A0A9D1Q0I1_9FIRM|nr:ABC transporter permease [Candidatus Protoclostridium stercorigallinarum]